MGELLERRGKVVSQRAQLRSVTQDSRSNVGGAVASEAVKDFMRIEQLLEKIRGYGCEVKDLNAGLIDFLSVRDGREVYLSWRYGEEPYIEHGHDLQTGFAGRQTIDEDYDFWTDGV